MPRRWAILGISFGLALLSSCQPAGRPALAVSPEPVAAPPAAVVVMTAPVQAPDAPAVKPSRSDDLLTKLLGPKNDVHSYGKLDKTAPLPAPSASPVPLPKKPLPALKPRDGQAGQPLEDLLVTLDPPVPPGLPMGQLAKTPPPEKLPLLPATAQPVPDRASLDDPTADHSVAQAQQSRLQPRETPLPFQKMVIPDPFEHANAVRLPPPVEDPLLGPPAAPTPRP